MPNEMKNLDRVFYCLSNSTRRQVVERLSIQPATMSELATPFDMALPSFLQHLQALEETELVRSTKTGRIRTYQINPPQILLAENWLDVQRRQWKQRLDQFDQLLIRLNEEQKR